MNIVTNNNSFKGRSDLQEILIHDEKNFSEITKEGYRTDFEITSKKPFSYYAFNMKNKNMSGTWHGKFSIETGKTIIEFTEEVTVKNPLMNLFLKSYLKNQQSKYIGDLKKALGE